jgi:hypothetical protein
MLPPLILTISGLVFLKSEKVMVRVERVEAIFYILGDLKKKYFFCFVYRN